jgi:hypothetical protein
MVWRHAHMQPLIHVEPTSLLSLSSSLSFYYFTIIFFSLFFSSLFSLFILSPFFIFSLISFLSLSFHFFSSFFILISFLSLSFFWQGKTSTILAMDGSYCGVLPNLPHTWTFVSHDTMSQVCDVGISFRVCPIT